MDESDIQTAPYGSRFVIPRGKRRKLNVGMTAVSEADLMARIQGWVGMIGRSRPIVIAIFPDDKPNIEKRAVYGLISEDVAIDNPYFARYRVPITLEQLI
jgi:hypothetical protein